MNTTLRRYYVTGGSGFIGRRICRRLSEKGQVRILCRRACDGPWTGADAVDLSRDPLPSGALESVDTVIHLAARTHAVDETGDTDQLYRSINVDGTRKLLEAASAAGVRRFVLMSSVKAMGESADEAQNESSPADPSTWYGRTKLAAEQLVLQGGFVQEPVVLRPALVYGPGVRGNLERMIDSVRSGRFPSVPEVGNRRSLVHVDDVAAAVDLAADAAGAAGRVFIVTDGRPVSTREMFEWISGGLNRPVPSRTYPLVLFRTLSRIGDTVGRIRGRRWIFDSEAYDKLFGSAWYDASAIETALGFTPQWTLETAIASMVDEQERRTPCVES
jgi:UDP-glucose 4-epimerase